MKIASITLGVAALLAVSACAGDDGGGGDEPSATTSESEEAAAPEPAPASEEPEETSEEAESEETSEEPEPEPTVDDDVLEALPSREEMEPWQRTLGEEIFVTLVRDENIGELYTDAELIAAGDTACDAFDGGKPLRGVLVDVAETLPRLESTDAVAQLAGAATGTLCPEHLPE